MYGVPTWVLGSLGLLMLALGAGAIFLIIREKRRLEQDVERAEIVANDLVDVDDDEAVTPPDIGGSLWGLVATWRHRAKAKRMARKGYVRWYKIGSNMSRPKWVKPAPRGAGVPEYYDSSDEQTYLFPEDGMITDQQTGAYVAIHKRNNPEPVPLRDPSMPAIDGDRLEEIINLEAESDAPGFFDRLDMDGQTIMWLMIGFVLLLGAAQQFMG